MATHRYRLPLSAAADRDVLAALLWQAGAVGVWERTNVLVAWFRELDAPVPDGGTWDVEPDRDWQEAWKATIAPVRAGRVLVVPSWLASTAVTAPGAISIVIDPGRAFGTGHHATTVGCLLALQALDLHGRRVLDVGTGTGVLAMAALRLGAGEVVAVDTDAEAIAVARDNLRRNEVELATHVGSLDAAPPGPYDVVVANLLTGTVVALADQLVAAASPGGAVIVSGVAADQRQRARDALAAAGACVEDVNVADGWATIAVRAPAAEEAR